MLFFRDIYYKWKVLWVAVTTGFTVNYCGKNSTERSKMGLGEYWWWGLVFEVLVPSISHRTLSHGPKIFYDFKINPFCLNNILFIQYMCCRASLSSFFLSSNPSYSTSVIPRFYTWLKWLSMGWLLYEAEMSCLVFRWMTLCHRFTRVKVIVTGLTNLRSYHSDLYRCMSNLFNHWMW